MTRGSLCWSGWRSASSADTPRGRGTPPACGALAPTGGLGWRPALTPTTRRAVGAVFGEGRRLEPEDTQAIQAPASLVSVQRKLSELFGQGASRARRPLRAQDLFSSHLVCANALTAVAGIIYSRPEQAREPAGRVRRVHALCVPPASGPTSRLPGSCAMSTK